MEKYKVIDTGINGKCLCVFENKNLLIYRHGKFYLIAQENKRIESVFQLPCPQWKWWAAQIRIFERILHVEPRWGIQVGKNEAFISYENSIFKVNVRNGDWKKEKVSIRGKPLFISKLSGVKGFEESYVLGDYGKNLEHQEVNIYQKVDGENENWKAVYTFPAGKVRHIHNIIPDRVHERVVILTGDEDSESGIWIAEDNFKKVYPLLLGKQAYRACQAIPFSNGILYLTDSPSEPNSVNCVEEDGSVRVIEELRGSCIYGIVKESESYFSTTCEPDAKAKNKVEYWLTRRVGKGIRNPYIDIIAISEKGSSIIASFKSDGLPLRLFQYASASFAYGTKENQYFTPVCVKKYDMHIFEIKKEKENEFIEF